MTSDTPVDILLVEDSPDDAELTIRALRKGGMANHIEWVTDGARAIEYLFLEGRYAGRASGNPKLVLLDLKLPLVSGLDVLRRVKADRTTKTIPVLILSSSREEADLVQSYGLGANGYVVKPIDFREFSDAVHAVGLFWLLVNTPPP